MDDDSSEVVGFIDIGTNSIHLLVVRIFEDSMGSAIFQDKETVRLGQSMFADGLIDKETINKTRLVVSRFAGICEDMGAGKIFALATCAAREAQNKKELMDAFKEDGIEVKIISGLEEARLIRLGLFGSKAPPHRCLGIDIGGGSTEIILCREEEDLYLDSLSMGAVRFAYACGTDHTYPMTFSEFDVLRRQVDLYSYRACRKVREIGFDRAYGSSGTMIALAEMCAAKRDGDASYMMYYELVELMKELYTKDVKGRLEVPGMNPSRADIIVAGGAIAEELMYLMDIDRIDISPNGLKQGMELDYLLKIGHSEYNIRDSSVRALANRCQYDRTHAERVRGNALLLFDKMKELHIHNMGGDMRELLSYAALLHDVGEFINYTKHHIHSYTIICNSFLPGFADDELRTMALMARFHHKKFPSPESKLFADMDRGDIQKTLMCAMMLKLADILDRHRNSFVESVDLTLTGGTVSMELGSDEDISMEIWKLNTVKDEFKGVFDLELGIRRV